MSTSVAEINHQLTALPETQENIPAITKLSIELIDRYCMLNKRNRLDETNLAAVYTAAYKLATVVEKESSGKVWRILFYNKEKLPRKAVQLLESSVDRIKQTIS